MKHTDPVMQEVWRAKAVNVKKYPTLAAYIAHLKALGERRRSDGHVLPDIASSRAVKA